MQRRILKSIEEFKIFNSQVTKERTKFEEFFTKENIHQKEWSSPGICMVCEKAVNFLIDFKYSDNINPNYRERFVCPNCNLNNRQRFLVGYIRKLMKTEKIKDVYLYEKITSLYKYINAEIKSLKLTGSEYLGSDKKPGEIINGIRHEDAENLSLPNESQDLIISTDVFEHVSDINRALKEACRVLKADGKMIFSVPFYFNKTTKRRAKIIDGKLVHLKPQQFHGNPLSDNGSLVFYDFGWDILDLCKSAGFQDAYMVSYYSLLYGHIGSSFQYTFIAEKGKGLNRFIKILLNSFHSKIKKFLRLLHVKI